MYNNRDYKNEMNRKSIMNNSISNIMYNKITHFDKEIIQSPISKLTSASDSMHFSFDMTKNEDAMQIPFNVPAFSKEKETDYSCISYLTSKRKPDVYVGTEVLTAKNYRVKVDNKKEIIEVLPGEDEVVVILDKKEADKAQSSSSSSEVIQDYQDMMKKDVRYFTTSNISIRCFNCNEVGHVARNCPNELMITCLRCQQKGHNEYDCPNVKCFKCHQIGHKSFECKVKGNEMVKCQSCENLGHEAEDCLIKPTVFKKRELKNFECFHCKQKGHLMCTFKSDTYQIEDYHSDDVHLSDTEEGEYNSDEDDFETIIRKAKAEQIKNNPTLVKRKRHRIFNKLDNKEIKSTIFCPKCSDMHDISECNVQLRFNSHDQRRFNYTKSFNFRSNTSARVIKKDNPFDEKYNKKNFYDDGHSSDESFSNVIQQEKRTSRKEHYSNSNNSSGGKNRNPFKNPFYNNEDEFSDDMFKYVEDKKSEDDKLDYFADYEKDRYNDKRNNSNNFNNSKNFTDLKRNMNNHHHHSVNKNRNYNSDGNNFNKNRRNEVMYNKFKYN